MRQSENSSPSDHCGFVYEVTKFKKSRKLEETLFCVFLVAERISQEDRRCNRAEGKRGNLNFYFVLNTNSNGLLLLVTVFSIWKCFHFVKRYCSWARGMWLAGRVRRLIWADSRVWHVYTKLKWSKRTNQWAWHVETASKRGLAVSFI